MVAWSQVLDDDPELGEALECTFGARKFSAAAGIAMRRRVVMINRCKTYGQGPQGKKRAVLA